MKIDRDKVKTLREKIQRLLDNEFGDPHNRLEGFSVRMGNASFTENNVTFKLEISVVGQDGTVLSKEAENFKRHAIFFGLKDVELGRSFRVMGHDYVIAGLLPKSKQYPIIGERNGKRFKFDVETVKRTLLPLS